MAQQMRTELEALEKEGRRMIETILAFGLYAVAWLLWDMLWSGR